MYVIIGGSGYLGQYILKNILENNLDDKIIATYNTNYIEQNSLSNKIQWAKVDISDFNSIDNFSEQLNKLNCNPKIIYLAAYHHPDKVMKNSDYAWNINITGLSRFLTNVKNIHTLYYASTEMVYGESNLGHIFNEEDATHPINKYGLQKALAEKLVLYKGYNVVRFPVLMGKSLSNKKHFTDEIIDCLKQEQDIEMLDDYYRNMIDFNQAAKFMLDLIEKYKTQQIGIVNICSDETLTKYDVAKKIAHTEKLDISYIKKINKANNTFFGDKRANILLLSNNKLKKLLNIDEIKINI